MSLGLHVELAQQSGLQQHLFTQSYNLSFQLCKLGCGLSGLRYLFIPREHNKELGVTDFLPSKLVT